MSDDPDKLIHTGMHHSAFEYPTMGDLLNTYTRLGVIGPNGAGKSTLFSFMILALSWNLLGGYGGQFSLGHAIFVGAGSYTFAVLLVHTAVPLYLAVPLSGVMAALIAALSGLLLLRLRAAYFSVGTLGLALAGLSWMINWSYTGGARRN